VLRPWVWAWKQPPAAHALGSLTPYKEAYVAWNGAAAPPQPEGGRVLVAAPALPVMEFTTATMRRPLPSTVGLHTFQYFSV
jgi:hypothetical protein